MKGEFKGKGKMETAQQNEGLEFYPNLAVNEIERDGLVYLGTETEPKENPELNGLTSSISKLNKVRGKNRTELLKSVTNKLIDWLKSNNNKTFTREQLNLFVGANNKMSKSRTINLILDFLKSNKLVEEVQTKKTYYAFKNEPLKSDEPDKNGCYSYGNISVRRFKFEKETTTYFII